MLGSCVDSPPHLSAGASGVVLQQSPVARKIGIKRTGALPIATRPCKKPFGVVPPRCAGSSPGTCALGQRLFLSPPLILEASHATGGRDASGQKLPDFGEQRATRSSAVAARQGSFLRAGEGEVARSGPRHGFRLRPLTSRETTAQNYSRFAARRYSPLRASCAAGYSRPAPRRRDRLRNDRRPRTIAYSGSGS